MLSDIVADQVVRLRRINGWSYHALSEQCRERGAAYLTANVITNIETGRRDVDGRRRRQVTVDELVDLAAALGVDPADLLRGTFTKEAVLEATRGLGVMSAVLGTRIGDSASTG